MSATASTKKPDEIKTTDSIEDGNAGGGADETAKPAPPKTEEPAKTEASKPEATMADTEKATPTAPPPSTSEPGPSGAAAATGKEEEVKSKPAENKTEVSSLNCGFSSVVCNITTPAFLVSPYMYILLC